MLLPTNITPHQAHTSISERISQRDPFKTLSLARRVATAFFSKLLKIREAMLPCYKALTGKASLSSYESWR